MAPFDRFKKLDQGPCTKSIFLKLHLSNLGLFICIGAKTPANVLSNRDDILKNKNREILIWIFFATLCIGFFLSLSIETTESVSGRPELIGNLDHLARDYFENLRNPTLNVLAYGVTQLGSTEVLAAITICFCILFLQRKDYLTSAQILFSALGSGILTFVLKLFFERSRPDIIFRLVEAEGYSYPSGHALAGAACYATLAIVCYKYLTRDRTRNFFSVVFCAIIVLVAGSRIYLGVHYFSDVIAGISLGVAWAAILAGIHCYLKYRKVS